MTKYLVSLSTAITLSLPVFASHQAAESESLVQYESLAYRCSFRPGNAASLERSEFYARYPYREKGVSLKKFSNWFTTTHPETSNLQCTPYKIQEVMSGEPDEIALTDSIPPTQSVIHYVFGDLPGGYTEELQTLGAQAYGRQYHDKDGEVVVIGFTGEPLAANGISERRPIIWVVKLFGWGKSVFITPCLDCVKSFVVFDRLWAAWQGLVGGSSVLKSHEE